MTPTTCTKCGEPMTFPKAQDVSAAAKELDEATRNPRETVRSAVAVGMAMGLLKMCALCIEGVCVFCQPIGGEGTPSLAQALGHVRALRVVREGEAC